MDNTNQTILNSKILKENFGERVENMNNLIIEKDNELIKQRNFYEDKLEKMINDHQISKDDIVNSYEKKINE